MGISFCVTMNKSWAICLTILKTKNDVAAVFSNGKQYNIFKVTENRFFISLEDENPGFTSVMLDKNLNVVDDDMVNWINGMKVITDGAVSSTRPWKSHTLTQEEVNNIFNNVSTIGIGYH